MFSFLHASRYRSEPIHLYEVSYGIGQVTTLRMTDAEEDVIVGANTFLANGPIRHSDINASGSLDNASIELDTVRTDPLVEVFRLYPPDSVVNLVIYRGERDDPAGVFTPMWHGRILNFALEGEEAKFKCEPVSTSVRRPGLRRTYQYGCPHVLYGPHCRANKAAATYPGAVVAISGAIVTLAPGWALAMDPLDPEATEPTIPLDPSKFLKGIAEWITPEGQVISRTILNILSVSANGPRDILLSGIPTGLFAAAQMNMVLGCNHGMSDCKAVHNNIPNFGGHPWIAQDNPLGAKNLFY